MSPVRYHPPHNLNPIMLWTDLSSVEPSALEQLERVARLPYIYKHVAVMPDVHFGIGATVGSVIAMRDAVSPAAVGVDIGCGMAALRTSLRVEDLPDDLGPLRAALEAAIPVGFHSHETISPLVESYALWNSFEYLHERVQDRRERAISQMGTLGGGNHFIELCADLQGRVWLMLHSGSRNIGKEIAESHIKIAKKLEHNATLEDPNLAVFLAGTPEMDAYHHDLLWAQAYARLSRETMLGLYQGVLRTFVRPYSVGLLVDCHHNYVALEHHGSHNVYVTRKGAISALAGQYGIIPGSMGTRSYIVRGLGNPDSFNSASHGAGRVMSRTQARKSFRVEDLESATAGVECRKDVGIIDEIPGAYKDIDEVMRHQADLVTVMAELKALLCVKG